MRRFLFLVWVAAASAISNSSISGDNKNNWAVIVDTSRYWYNYRHVANALSFYHTVKRLGFPDERIILFLGEDTSCNPRNSFPGSTFNDQVNGINLYGEHVAVDFRGDEVTVDSFLRTLTGRQPPWTPRTKRLLSDENSNVFLYMTGHGGDEFLKFRDWEEITSQDIGDALHQMWIQKRYRRLFFVSDTCQAGTLQNQFYSPDILALGCSKRGQNSWAHHSDRNVGVSMIDRFTYYALRHVQSLTQDSPSTVEQFVNQFNPRELQSEVDFRTDLFREPLESAKLMDFMASRSHAVLVAEPASLGPPPGPSDFSPWAGRRTHYGAVYADENYRPGGGRRIVWPAAFRGAGTAAVWFLGEGQRGGMLNLGLMCLAVGGVMGWLF